MTNKDKFLRDGVSVEEFARDIFKNANISQLEYIPVIDENSLKRYLRKQNTPTLTEDERVILRNIDKEYDKIGRQDGEIMLRDNGDYLSAWLHFRGYNHLFQFIQERRRI